MKAETWIRNHRELDQRDTWNRVKPGVGAYVSVLSGAQEMDLMGVVYDHTAMDPLDIICELEEYEEGTWIL